MGVSAALKGETPKIDSRSGQMTVEFVVVFPAVLVVAVIAINALLFFGQCATFDRVAREAVRIAAASPTYGQSQEQTLVVISQMVDEALVADNLSSTVAVSARAAGHATYTATLRFSPTLFGLGLKSSIVGVELPCLEHSVSLTVDSYKPGVLL